MREAPRFVESAGLLRSSFALRRGLAARLGLGVGLRTKQPVDQSRAQQTQRVYDAGE